MANLSLFPFILLLMIIYETNGLSFRLIHHDSLDLSSYQSNLTIEQKARRLILSSKVRSGSHQVARPRLHRDSGQYTLFVEVGIGTFMDSPTYKTYYLELDTGSDLIWTQCQGCNPCFHQRDPVFPWNISSTYRAFPCNQCRRSEQGCCKFDISYPDGSRIQGVVATETFTVGSSNVSLLHRIPKLRFGCVISSRNFYISGNQNNIASGIFGMSRHSSSFTSQAKEQLGGRFSYCLTPMDYQGKRPPMFLRFGKDIPSLSWLHRQRTPFIQGSKPLYYLNLRSISVGSERLNLNPSIFKARQDGSGGCFITTGSAVSYLIKDAYIEFVRVLKQKVAVKNPGITMVSRSPICYKQPRPRTASKFPTLIFHFENGAKFVVKQEAYMMGFTNPNAQVYCLMIHSSNTFTLFGAYQQANHRFIYDMEKSELQFALANCISNN